MGIWGAALYSGDFATDLRATIGAVVRLPFDVDRLVGILCETEPAAAFSSKAEDHATFWLILADQFARRGIASERVRETALAIIDSGKSIATAEQLGMKPSDVARHRKVLEELRTRLLAPVVPKQRSVLAKPQPLLMNVGDVIVFPTCKGKCVNPYYASKELDRQYTREGPIPWQQDGWGAAVIADCGRAFDFLAWYRPLTLAQAMQQKPTLGPLRGPMIWRVESPGTCSRSHFKKMELEHIGTVPVDVEKLRAMFPLRRPGISAAVSDISIANRLFAMPYSDTHRPTEGVRVGRAPAIAGLEHVLVE